MCAYFRCVLAGYVFPNYLTNPHEIVAMLVTIWQALSSVSVCSVLTGLQDLFHFLRNMYKS